MKPKMLIEKMEETLWAIYNAHEEPHSSSAVIKHGMEQISSLIQAVGEEIMILPEFNLGEAIRKANKYHEPYMTQKLIRLHTEFIEKQQRSRIKEIISYIEKYGNK